MLTPPSHLLILHMFGKVFQDYCLPSTFEEIKVRVTSYSLRVIALQNLGFDLLENRSDIFFLLILGNLPRAPWPVKVNQEWLCNNISPPLGLMHPNVSYSLFCRYEVKQNICLLQLLVLVSIYSRNFLITFVLLCCPFRDIRLAKDSPNNQQQRIKGFFELTRLHQLQFLDQAISKRHPCNTIHVGLPDNPDP